MSPKESSRRTHVSNPVVWTKYRPPGYREAQQAWGAQGPGLSLVTIVTVPLRPPFLR